MCDQPQKIQKQTFPPAPSRTTPGFLDQFACKMEKLHQKEKKKIQVNYSPGPKKDIDILILS